MQSWFPNALVRTTVRWPTPHSVSADRVDQPIIHRPPPSTAVGEGAGSRLVVLQGPETICSLGAQMPGPSGGNGWIRETARAAASSIGGSAQISQAAARWTARQRTDRGGAQDLPSAARWSDIAESRTSLRMKCSLPIQNPSGTAVGITRRRFILATSASVICAPLIVRAASLGASGEVWDQLNEVHHGSSVRLQPPSRHPRGRWSSLACIPYLPSRAAQPASPASCDPRHLILYYSPPPPASPLRSIGGADPTPMFPADGLSRGTTRRKYCQRMGCGRAATKGPSDWPASATILSHVTSIAAEVAHGLSDRAA